MNGTYPTLDRRDGLGPDLEHQTADLAVAGFSLDRDLTEVLMSACKDVLRTGPIGLVAAAVLNSFELVFGSLELAKAFYQTSTEGVAVDLLTDIRPIPLDQAFVVRNGCTDQERLAQMIAMIKNAYRRILQSGSPDGDLCKAIELDREHRADREGTEILFRNFNDRTEIGWNAARNEDHSNSATKVEIFTLLEKGLLRIKIVYPANTSAQEGKEQWVAACEQSLRSAIHLTQALESPKMIKKYALLQLKTDAELAELIESCRSQLGGRQSSDIEDILPCTPMQQGFVLMRIRSPHLYQLHMTWQLRPRDSAASIDILTLERAWQQVVEHHQILRTLIVHSNLTKINFLQVVFKRTTPLVTVVDCDDETEIKKSCDMLPKPNMPQNHLVIYRTSKGKLYYRMVFHHALTDGISLTILHRDFLKALGGALDNDQPSPQYNRFVYYVYKKGHNNEGLSAWNDLLSGLATCKFPAFCSGDGERPQIVLRRTAWTATRSSAIRSFCKKIGISLSSFFRSIWALVLRRYTGSDDVCFGTLSSGRRVPIQGSGSIIGPMVTILTCRAQMTSSMSVETFFKNMMNGYARSLPFQHCSLAEITRNQGLGGGENLFNTMVNFMREDPTVYKVENSLYISEYVEHSDAAEFDNTLDILDQSATMSMTLRSWTSFMREEEADGIISTFNQAITSVVTANSEQSLEGLKHFSQEDASKLQSWYKCSLQPIHSTIHEEISHQAAMNPSKEALCSTSQNMTYERLESLSNNLACFLAELGAKRGSAIPFCIEKSPLATMAMLGVLKAGATFVPLDPSNPPARLNWLVDRVQASILLISHSTREIARGLERQGLKVVMMEDVMAEIPHSMSPLPQVDPADSAYIVFTSGSTGKPKGVVVSHRAVCGTMPEIARAYHIDDKSRSLQFAAYNFDAMVCEIFITLMAGGTIVQPNDEERLENLSAFVTDMSPNFMFLTPTVLRTIQPDCVTGPLTIVAIGETLGRDLIDCWCKKAVLINSYGPTESCIACTAVVLGIGASGSSIGKPFGSRAWVVSPQDHNCLVPIGSIGELLIEGPNLADGYFMDELKTNTSFIRAPTWVEDLGLGMHYRFYKTGDLVRQSVDGSLTYLGRMDTQVKVRGQRVELGEIEHQLEGVADVEQGVVIVPKEGRLWSGDLVAAICLSQYGDSSAIPPDPAVGIEKSMPLVAPTFRSEVVKVVNHCRQQLEQGLPLYMVPSFWIPFTRFPMLSSGKTDRLQISLWLNDNASKAWGNGASVSGGTQTQTTDPIEQKIRHIWAQVLDLPEKELPLDRSFLSLGGSSISAMTVASISRASELDITFQMLLQRRTIAELAATIGEATKTGEPQDQAFYPSPVQSFCLTVGQSGLAHGVRIVPRQPLDPAKVFAAVKALVDRHSILRAQFRQEGGKGSKKWRILIKEGLESWRWRTHQLETMSSQELEMIYSESQNSVTTVHGPTFSADLINAQDTSECTIIFTANVLVVDAQSWRIILEDLEAIMRRTPMQPVSLPFRGWANNQAARAQSSTPFSMTQENLEYWGLASSESSHHEELVINFAMDQDETEALMSICNRALRTDPMDLIIAAALDSFERTFTDRELPTVFCERDGREPSNKGINIARTVGYLTEFYPLTLQRPDPIAGNARSRNETFKETIMMVKDFRRKYGSVVLDEQNPMEILFKALRDLPDLVGIGTLIQGTRLSNECYDSRLSVLEVSPLLEKGLLRLRINFSAILVQERIIVWATEYQSSLRELITITKSLDTQPTLQDYPLLGLTSYAALGDIMDACCSQLDIQDLADIEDIYPCSPIQEGMLLAQSRATNLYYNQVIWKLRQPAGGTDVDVYKLQQAWKSVVQQHQILRTRFVETSRAAGVYLQVVLAKKAPNMRFMEVDGLEDVLAASKAACLDSLTMPSEFAVYQTASRETFCSFAAHHAIFDANSSEILLRDVLSTLNGSQLEDSKNRPGYREFITHLAHQDRDAATAHWQKELAGTVACLFPVLQAADFGSSSAYRHERLKLSAEETASIKDFCREAHVTISTFFRAVWAILLRCYTGSDDTCFGAVASGRDIAVPEVQNIVGPLLTMLVCSTQIEATMDLPSLMEDMQKSYLSNLTAQHFSLGKVQSALGLHGGEGLFNSTVNLLVVPNEPKHCESWATFEEVAREGPVEYDISLTIQDAPTTIGLSLDYWESCVSTEQAESILSTISQTVTSIVADPLGKVGDLALLSPQDAMKARSWYTDDIESVHDTIHERIGRQTLIQPGTKIAIRSTTGSLTYTELDSLSGRLAQNLIELGVGVGCAVPFCLEKSVFGAVAMLGILKTGAAFVPLDPAHPTSRLEWLIDEIEADVILCSRDTLDMVQQLYKDRPSTQSRIRIRVVEEMTTTSPYSPSSLPKVDPSSTAYIIFTSGSTGRPKGVVMSHQAAYGGIQQCAKAFRIHAGSRSLQFSAYTWDAMICEIFSTLDSGGTVFVPSEVQRLDSLVEFIEEMRLNWMFLTPTVLKLFPPGRPSSTEMLTIITIGELLGQDLIERWHGKALLLNAYGPTESCIACTVAAVQNGASGQSIGMSFGSRAWVVQPGDHNRLSPLGSIGKLLIEGPNLAQQYFKDPVETAAAFINDPPRWVSELGLQASYRFFKTGDLVRQNVDGSLMFLGREDGQIKINGQRVELGEVEHQLLGLGPIRHAISVLPKGGPWKDKLVAVFTLLRDFGIEKGESFSILSPLFEDRTAKEVRQCRQKLEECLPAYMVPTIWVPLSRLPVLSSGKTDRSTLSQWLCGADEKSEQQVQAWTAISNALGDDELQPRTPAQEKLQKIWAEALSLPESKVSINRSFLSLGGDSISAIAVASRSRAYGISVSVQDLLRRKTIEELAPSGEGDGLGIQEQASKHGFALSATQALYLAAGQDQLDNPGLFINSIRPLKSEEIFAAARTLVIRHPMLRARFCRQEDGDWMQSIVDDVEDSWIYQNHHVETLNEIHAIYASRQSAIVVHNSPAFSVDLIHVRLEAEPDWILLTVHGLVADGDSWDIIVDDLEGILRTGAPSQPVHETFHAWMNQQTAASEVVPSPEIALDYWGLQAGYQQDLKIASFSIGREETNALMTSCNQALRTHPADLIIASVLDAFKRVFTDRKLPVVFSERDRRHSQCGGASVAKTVGLLMDICPVIIQEAEVTGRHDLDRTSLMQMVMMAKDALLGTKHTMSCKDISAGHKSMEVFFRACRTTERPRKDGDILRTTILPSQRRRVSMAVFEIDPCLEPDSLTIRFSYSSRVLQQAQVIKFIEECAYSLRAVIRLTAALEPRPTLQDYPLLKITSYADLDKMMKSCLSQLDVQRLDDIEEIYPCSPMQEGILLAEAKAPGSVYDQRLTWKIESTNLDSIKFEQAWQAVVDRHVVLRTTFVEHPLQERLVFQAVRRHFQAQVAWMRAHDYRQFQAMQEHDGASQNKVLHRLVVCETSNGEFYCTFNFNHTLADASSVQIIIRDLQLAYSGLLESNRPYSYVGFMSYLTQRDPIEVREYWKNALEGVEACAFPRLAEIDRDNSESPEWARQSLVLTASQVSQLRHLRTKFGITTAVLSNTLWALILRIFLGREDVCFGYLASGRDIDVPGIQTMVGPLISLFICHVKFSPTLRLLDLAQAIQEDYLQSLGAQHYSLAEVYHDLGLQGDHLFDTVVNVVQPPVFPELQKIPSDSALNMVMVAADTPSEFDVSLNIIYTDDEVKMDLSYRLRCLSENIASSIMDTMSRVLDALLDNPELQVCQIETCDEVQQQSLSDWKPLDDIESEACLHETIECQAAKTPDAPAICAYDGDFSYCEVRALSNQLAHRLVEIGVGPNVHVPFCFEKSKWSIIAILGILKAGGACVPLDPSYPEARLQYMLSLVDATVVVTSVKYADLVSHLVAKSLAVDESLFTSPENRDAPPVTGVRASDPAYIIFSSGTTGEPKGSILEHRSIQAFSRILDNSLNFGPSSRVLQFASFVFDVSIEEILGTLIFGGCICIPQEQDRLGNLAAVMEDMRVNWADLTPTVIRTLLPADVPSLKTLCIGGELLGDDLINLWSGFVDIFNVYGPCECSVTIASSKALKPGDSGTNIGRGYGCRIWLVDPNDYNALCPVGAIGEILVEGGHVGRGYCKDPVQTSAVFIKNPRWSLMAPNNSGKDRRMYRTGDLARCNHLGELLFLGRKDQQVKIRGQRVELGEIEFHLAAHIAISYAAALVPSKGWAKGNVVAVVVLKIIYKDAEAGMDPVAIDRRELGTNAANDLSEVSESLKSKLPSHMVPSTIIPVYSLPLLLSGKVNRRTLRQWVENMDQETSEMVRGGADATEMPTNVREEQIQAIWSEVLDMPLCYIGVNMSFLSLGGDSVSAMKVASRSRISGIPMTVQDLLRRKTIVELAQMMPQDGTLEPVFELSSWQTFRLSAKRDQLTSSLLLRITRQLEANTVSAAVQLLVSHHPILRTCFHQDAYGEWRQKLAVEESRSWAWRAHQVQTFNEIEDIWASSQKGIKAKDTYVFSVDLICVQDGTTYILLIANEMIVDLESWRIIFEDLEDILRTGALLHPPSASYQAWHNQHSVSVEAATLPKLEPNYWGSQAGYSHELQVGFLMSQEETDALMTSCNYAFRTTPIDLVIAAALYAFENVFTDRGPPSVFSERRKHGGSLDIDRTVGFLTNIYPLRLQRDHMASEQRASRHARLTELIKQVKDAYRSCKHAADPRYETMEILFREFNQLQRLGGNHSILHVNPLPLQQSTASDGSPRIAFFDISSAWEQGSLAVKVHYPAGTAHGERIAQWIDQCQDALRAVIHITGTLEPEATLSDYPLLRLGSYGALNEVMNSCHSQLGVKKPGEIEDIYPCSPMQEGMLLAQSKSANLYKSEIAWRVKTPSGNVDTEKLKRAWETIVKRHGILRTRFIEAFGATDSFLQVVLAQPSKSVRCFEVDGPDNVNLTAKTEAGGDDESIVGDPKLTISQTTAGDTYIKLAINHAIYDGDSLAMLVRDFTFELNDIPPPEHIPLYRDFIAHVLNQQPENTITHWRDELVGATFCKFPVIASTDFIHNTYGRETVTLSQEQTLALRKLCRETDITPSVLFRAVWVIILRCFTGSDDTCFGAVASGRDIPVSGSQDIMGPMITLLVCRTRVDPSTTVSDLLQNMQNSYLNNLPFQHCSLAKIYNSLGLRAGEQLFNTVVNFKAYDPGSKLQYNESWTHLVEATGDGSIEYDISFNIEDCSTVFDVSLDYWSSCFSKEQAGGVLSTVCQAIASIIEDPQQKVGHLTLFSSSDAFTVREWHKGEICQPFSGTIHGRIEHQASLYTTKTAIRSTALEVSYEELDGLANRLAMRLVQVRVGQGSAVSLCMDKSIWGVVAMLGVLKAGAAFIPLDPSHPPNRLSLLVNKTESAVLLCSRNTREIVKGIDSSRLHVLVVEDIADTPVNPVCSLPQVNPSDTAYIIFTSGSTGTPKGVVVSHRAACGSMTECAKAFRLDKDSRSLQFSAYTWDAIVCEIFATLECGGTVFVPNEEERTSGLVDYIEREGLNWLFLTPTVLRLIPPARIESQKLTIVTIGELLGRDLIEYWHDKAVLINAYGPTETCVACTAKVIESADDISSNAIGKPFGSRAWVTAPGDHNLLMPVGSIGELVIEGPHIAEGYYKDPETTADLFIERPQWASGTIYRFYKTGDLVRQNRDGSLIFLGRKDTQVKVNGQRVELEEVEHHLNSLEFIKNAVALVAKEGPLAGKLTVLVSASHYANEEMKDTTRAPNQIPLVAPQLRGIAASDVTQFRKQLEDRLPIYMIPTCWIPLTHLPMVASGKIDRSLIQRWLIDPNAPNWVVSEEAKGQPQPATPVEVKLQEIWADVLNLPPVRIGTDRSFLSLGGDSISAIKIVSRSRSHGIRATVQDLLQRKTITELASLYAAEPPATVQRRPSKRILGISPTDVSQIYPLLHLTSNGALDHVTKTCCSQLGIQPADIEDVYPCSPVQEGILLAQARSTQVYDQRLAWKISDASKNTHDITQKLQSAWQILVNRHAILRTAFVEYPLPEHHFVQVVLRQASASTSLTEVEKYEQLGSEKATFQPPSRKALHHFTICNTANHDIYCMLEFNHALGDATSVQIIVHELCLAYDSQLKSDAPPYSSFISYLTSQDVRGVQSHWEAKLADAEACEFPKMGDTGLERSSRMQESLKIDALQFSSLRRLCSKSGITLATLASAIWALILSLFLGRDDVCFGYLASGRDIDVPDVREIVGPLVTLLVSHTKVNFNLTLLQVAQALQEGHVQSLPVQHYSLAKVYHALGMGGERLFNTVVNVLYFPESLSSDQSLSMTPTDGVTPSEFDISFDFVYSDTEAQIDLMYDSDYLSHTLASSMITTVSRVLLALLKNPDMEISRLSVCDELQQASLSDASESTEPLMCVHEIIKQQTLQSPQADAVCAHDGNLSYADLWTMSDKVSRHLANLGVKPNTYIPFCFEKSKWSIVAILSILKAGGCCVPLDPSYPSSRLEYMVDLVDATIVLASTAKAHLVHHMVTNPVIIDDAFFTGHSEDIGVNPTTSVQPDDAAYVIFTSGTTGEPKASVLEHKSLQAYLSVLGTSLNLDAQSRVIQFASFVFDISIEEILGTLSLGGCICVPSEDERLNDLALAMESRRVNWANLTPTVIRMLTPADVPHLKTLVSGGEALGDDLIKRWAPAVDMFNTLGPSECTIAVLLTEKLRSQDSGMNLGKGRSCKIWIANPKDYHLLSSVGAIGEILIEGRQVGRGYVKDPEQTSKAFITDPAWSNRTSKESRRMYRSGDLARFNEDGTITYLGRKDHQIKIRGQRVELAEIEYHLSANPSVRSATVAFPRNGRLKGHLVAIVVLKTASLEQADSDGTQIKIASEGVGSSTLLALHASLEHVLPRHMVPSFTIPIISMPLLLSGKVNHRAVIRWLEGMEQEVCELLKNSNNLKTGDMPTNDVESCIRTIWGQLLNLSECRIGVTNSFFSLGGDSILAMQLSSRLREGKLNISVQDIFEQKTIARIAGLAQLSNGNFTEFSMRQTHAISDTQIREAFLSTFEGQYDDSNIEDVFPCSSIQESILTAQAVEPDAWTALMLFEVRLQQPGQESVDLDLLQDAWLKVVNHHGILRTIFIPVEHQNLWRHGQVVLTHIHPSIVRCEMSKSQASTLGHNVREMPKHLPAHQLTIVRTSSGETILSLQLSHALYDAMAISILLRDLRLAYDGAILASSPSYGAYITNARSYQDHSSEAHWKSLLKGFRPESIAVADLKNPPQEKAMRIIQADVADFSKLQNYCQEQSMTIANLFQCVWAICLRSICGEDDICFGNMVSGRELAGSAFHGAVGPCVNILPCRVVFGQHETIDSLHKALERDLFTTLSHHHSSIEDIRRSLGMENKSLFDTYLNVRRTRHQNQDYASALSFHYMDSYMLEQYQVVVYIDELDDGVTISLSYQSQCISDRQAREQLELIQHVLYALVEDSAARLVTVNSNGCMK